MISPLLGMASRSDLAQALGMKSSRLLTRRNFLKSAAVAGAAPLILRSNLFGADAPSKQITMGCIGTGKQGKFLMGGFLGHRDVRVVAVSDVDTTRRKDAKRIVEARYAADMTSGAYKGCDDYSNFEELLARKDIDTVMIATPDHWHALIAIAAARAGKDIYCEKPMAHTILEGRAMVNAVRKNKRIFQTGSMQRSSAEFRTACELVRNGVIGTVSKADVMVGDPSRPCDLPAEPDEPGLDWNRWLGMAPMRPYNAILSPRGVHDNFPEWRSYREYGGGGVSDWGAHHFDIVQWGMGFDETGPVEFIAAEQASDKHGVRLRYANGLEVTHKDGNDIFFYGDKGKIHVNRGKFQLWLGDTLKTEGTGRDSLQIAQDLLPAKAVRLYKSENQLTDFLNCVKSRKLPICDVETGHRTASICCLINQVYAHHQSIKWDPKREKITSANADPGWLTREYRAPWKLET
jgi:predicted dehydrogenase